MSKPRCPTDYDDDIKKKHQSADDEDESEDLLLEKSHARFGRICELSNFTEDSFVTCADLDNEEVSIASHVPNGIKASRFFQYLLLCQSHCQKCNVFPACRYFESPSNFCQ